MPQPAGCAGERLFGLELSSRNFPASRPAGEAAAAALPSLPAPRAGIWRRHLPLLPGAQASAPAPRLPRPRRREKKLPLVGAACLPTLPLPWVGRRLRSMERRCQPPELTYSGEFVNFIWKITDVKLTDPKLKIIVFSGTFQGVFLSPH